MTLRTPERLDRAHLLPGRVRLGLRRPGPSVYDSAAAANQAGQATGRAGSPVKVAVRVIAAAAVVSAALTGCGAGQRAQTANEYSVVDGATANLGALAIRDAAVTSPPTAVGYPAGASVTLRMTVANSGGGSDTLTSVSTPTAASAKVSGPAKAPSLIVPSNGAIVVGAGSGAANITLTGLKYRLVPGQLVPVTMNFKVAGQVTVQLPVELVANQTGGETIDIEPTTRAGA